MPIECMRWRLLEEEDMDDLEEEDKADMEV
jgi:hypothetical protein